MVIPFLLAIAGFVLLIFAANWLVDGASMLAKKFKISDLAIGLTIVAFGTSAPELVVNTVASVNDHPGIILGNIIGSNNFNLFIILGITALIFPITVKSSTAWKEIPISLVAALLFLLLACDFFLWSKPTVLSRLDGLVLFILFLLFLYYVFRQMKNEPQEEISSASKPLWKLSALIIIGLSALVAGGRMVVTNSIGIAATLGVSEQIIGLTIVAAGTSLPELVTSVVAAIKRNSDIAIGNVIGSNIFNILLILAISGVINPIAYDYKFNTDIFILIGGTVLLMLFMLTGKRKRLDRWEGAILLLIYTAYTIYLVLNEL